MKGYHPSDDGGSFEGVTLTTTTTTRHEESVPLTISTTPQLNGYGAAADASGSADGAASESPASGVRKPRIRAGTRAKKPGKKSDTTPDEEQPDDSFDPEDPNADPLEYVGKGEHACVCRGGGG